MTDGNAIVSYVPVGKSRFPWRALALVVGVCGAAVYVAKAWQDPQEWIPGYRAWLAHRAGKEQARMDLAFGTAELQFDLVTMGPDSPPIDPQTGLRISCPTCLTCAHDPGFQRYARAYNRTVREWIAANGLPANSVRGRFRDPAAVASALDAGRMLAPGSAMTLPDGRCVAWCVGDDDALYSSALTVFNRDGTDLGRVYGVAELKRIACDDSAVFARVRTSSGKQCDVVLDTKLKTVLQVFPERVN